MQMHMESYKAPKIKRIIAAYAKNIENEAQSKWKEQKATKKSILLFSILYYNEKALVHHY